MHVRLSQQLLTRRYCDIATAIAPYAQVLGRAVAVDAGSDEDMIEAGLTFNGEPITFQAGDQLKQGIGTKVAYFDDPDGTHLEIIQPQGPFQRKGHEGL